MTVSVFPPTAGGGGGGGTDTGWSVVDSFSVTQNGKAAVDLAATTYWFQVQSTPNGSGSVSIPLVGGDFKTVANFAFDSAGQAGAYVTFDTVVTELLTVGISGYITIASFDADVSPVSFSATQLQAFGQPMSVNRNNRYPNAYSGWDHFQENSTHIMLQRGTWNQNWQMIMNKATGAWSYPTYYWTGSQVQPKSWQYGKTGLGRNVILQANGTTSQNTFDRFTWDEAKNTYWRESSGVDVNKTIPGQATGVWFFAYDDNVGTNGRFYNSCNNSNRIYYSDDNGDTWTLGGNTTTNLYDLSVAEDGTVFAKTSGNTQTIYYSSDNGVTFNAFVAPLNATWHRPVWNEAGGFWTLSHTALIGSVYTAATIGNTWTPRTFTSSYVNAHPRVVDGKTVVMFKHMSSSNRAAYATSVDTWNTSPYVNYQNYISNYSPTNYGPTATFVHDGMVKAWADYFDLPPLLFDPADNKVHWAGYYNDSSSGYSQMAQSPDAQNILVTASSIAWLSEDGGKRWYSRNYQGFSHPIWFKGGFLIGISGSSTGYRITPQGNNNFGLVGWSKPGTYHNTIATNGKIVVWGSNGTNYNGWTTGGDLGTEIITSSIGTYSYPCFGPNGDAYLVYGNGTGLYSMDTTSGAPSGGAIKNAAGSDFSGLSNRLNWNGNVYAWQFNSGQLIMRKLTPTLWEDNISFGDATANFAYAGITTIKGSWISIDSRQTSSPYAVKRWLINPDGSTQKIVTESGYPTIPDDASSKYNGEGKLGTGGYGVYASLPIPEFVLGQTNTIDFNDDTHYQPYQLTSLKIVYEEN